MTRQTLSDLRLTREERDSKLWRKVAAHLAGELVLLRVQNDSVTLNIADTTAKRGEIRLVKRMLALADEAGPASRPSDGTVDTDDDAAGQFFPPHGG